MSQDAWNPAQYEKFKNQRSQPFFDLMALLEKPSDPPRVIDLGCGTGELTAELHRYLQAKETVGIDSSESMLSTARTYQTESLKFKNQLIENWKSEKPFDIIFSNAALQWCSDHPKLFTRIAQSLSPLGQIAVQMPMNHDYPTHILADKMSKETKWAKLLNNQSRDQDQTMLTAEQYANLLFKLGFKQQKVFLRVYGHELESREGVIEWVKGTLLTFFKSRLSEGDYETFTSEFRQRLFQILPDDKPFFYPFKRILIWGRK
jgi:trans-aconitate 2-methyltransferase